MNKQFLCVLKQQQKNILIKNQYIDVNKQNYRWLLHKIQDITEQRFLRDLIKYCCVYE